MPNRRLLLRAVCLSASFGAALIPVALSAQLAIRPIVVYMNERERVADFTVRNESDASQEVTIDFRFGYLRSDSVGTARMVYDDTASARSHSMAAWASAFPRRFVLGPGVEQVVRLGARPPAGTGDGVYWTRLVTGSQPASRPAESAATGVSPTIAVRLEQVTTVLYKQGLVTNAITVGALGVRDTPLELTLQIPVTRTGSAPFIGQSRLLIRNEQGQVVHEARSPMAVYFDLIHRMAVPRSALKAGSYTAEVRIDNETSDIPGDALPRVKAPPARVVFTVR